MLSMNFPGYVLSDGCPPAGRALTFFNPCPTGQAGIKKSAKNLVKIHYTESTANYAFLIKSAISYTCTSVSVELVPRFSFTAFQCSVIARFTQF